jgi:hypothetical protein
MNPALCSLGVEKDEGDTLAIIATGFFDPTAEQGADPGYEVAV